MHPRIAVFSVLFPANIPFFKSFIDSLLRQTYKEFDVILVTHEMHDINKYIQPYIDQITIRTFPVEGSISKVRLQGISWAKSLGYTFLSFVDSDDIQDPNRVKREVDLLESNCFVTHDLIPFVDENLMEDSPTWKVRLPEGILIDRSHLRTCNVVGLGNTALRVEMINLSSIPENIQAIDWFLFHQWLKEKPSYFTHASPVRYRQHSDNTADRVIKICNVKLAHYDALKSATMRPEILKHKRLLVCLENDYDFTINAINQLNSNGISYFWWEETNYLHV
jgi:glycosyltransferase involved in cell wall biosynthesis